jgi:hypothetical protein
MPVAPETTSGKRERRIIPLSAFSFHRENIDHGLFQVSITDKSGPFVYEVRTWGNMIRTVEAFTSSIAHVGMAQRTKVDIYRTGYALVNGFNVRVTPLS